MFNSGAASVQDIFANAFSGFGITDAVDIIIVTIYPTVFCSKITILAQRVLLSVP